MQPCRARRRPQGARGLRPERVVPVPGVAREHRQAPALGVHQGEQGGRVRWRSLAMRPSHVAANDVPVHRADDHVHVGVARGPRIGRARQVAGEALGQGVDGRRRAAPAPRAAAPFHGHPGRRGSRRPAVDAVVAAPRRPLAIRGRGRRCRALARAPRPARRRRTRRCATVGASARRGARRNSSRNGWWWPYSSPSVAMTTSGGSSSGGGSTNRGTSRSRPNRSASAVARARTRPRPTGRRRRDATTMVRRRPGRRDTAGACRADDPATCHGARIVWATPSSASTRSVARSTAVSGSHSPVGRRPKRSSKSRSPQRISVRRSAAEASGRIAWWNAWAIPLTAAVAGDEAASRRPGRRRAASGQRRPEVPRDPGEVAGLRVRPVALGADAGVPVVRTAPRSDRPGPCR